MKNFFRLIGFFPLCVFLLLDSNAYATACGDQSCYNDTCSGTCSMVCDDPTDCGSYCKSPDRESTLFGFRQCTKAAYDALIPNALAIAPPSPGCEWFCNPPAGSCYAANNCTGWIADQAYHLKGGGKCKKCNTGAWSNAKDCSLCGKYNNCDVTANPLPPIGNGNIVTGTQTCLDSPPDCTATTTTTTASPTTDTSATTDTGTTTTTTTGTSFSSFSSLASMDSDLTSIGTLVSTSSTSGPSSTVTTSTSSAPTSSTSSSTSTVSSTSTSAGTAPGTTPSTNAYCTNSCPLYADTWSACQPGWVLSKYRHCSGRTGTICTPSSTTKTRSRNPRCGEPVPNRLDP